MRQLQTRQILLFRILRDHCSFLTRRQIERVLTLSRVSTTKTLQWLLSEQYLNRRYRADSFANFQTPVYYLGKRGWHVVGKPVSEYGPYRLQIEQRSERTFRHTLSLHDVILKFVLESDAKRIILGEDALWQESIDFGNVPDAWIQYGGGAAFIEIDLGTEHVPVLKKKLDTYIAFKESGRYARLFPGCPFKVLVFTTTEERIEALERVTTTDDIWYCTLEEFVREQLTHEHWFALLGSYALSITPKKEV
jgi:Replication-relaxation